VTFSYDETLADPLSRSRAMLLDTSEPVMLFPDEAYNNYADLYGWDVGTANLAVIAKNKYGNMPSSATLDGLGGASWRDRMAAWDTVIAAALGGAVSGSTEPLPDAEGNIPPDVAVQNMQVETVYVDDPYVLRDMYGHPIPRERWRTPW
jgi:hypothetical protein